MLAILPTLDKLPVYNILTLLIFSVSTGQCNRNGEKRFISQRMENMVEKYIDVVKRFSDEFPHHQIELHLDITGGGYTKPHNQVSYIHLREHPQANSYLKGKPDNQGNQMPKPIYFSRTVADPDMAPVYMKDLRNAMEEMEKKYNGTRAGIDSKVTSPQELDTDINMKKIINMLQKGELVDPRKDKPPEDPSNMSWLKIKIPKMSL